MKTVILRQWRKRFFSYLIDGNIGNKLLFLLLILLIIIICGSLIAMMLFSFSVGDALWWSWTHVIDPGFIGDDKDATSKKIFGSLFSILGLLLLGGAFITLSEEAARRVIDRMMKGKMPDDISNHTIIAGKGEKLKAFIRALDAVSKNNDNVGNLLVVVPDQKDLEHTRDILGHDTVIVVDRIGNDEKDDCLELAYAKRIILIDNFAGDRTDAGAMLKTILRTLELRTRAIVLDSMKTGYAGKRVPDNMVIYAEINDFSLADSLRFAIGEIVGQKHDVEIHIINISDASARLALRRNPLDCVPISPYSHSRVALIIEGWTPFARALFWQAVRVAHFPSKPTKIIIVYPGIEKIKSEIFTKAPGLNDDWCREMMINIEFQKNIDLNSLSLTDLDIVTIAVCSKNQDKSFTRALGFREEPIPGLRQIYLELEDGSGYRSTLEKLRSDIPLVPVGASAEAFELAEKLDGDAERLHDRYLEQREKQNRRKKLPDGINYESRADYDWNNLDEIRRGWNRSSADHIEVKLRVLADFYSIAENRPIYNPATGKTDFINLESIIIDIVRNDVNQTRDDIELLARLEHDRWCAEKLAEGWRFAEKKDEKKKYTPYLIPYDSLTDELKGYDREAVIEILKSILSK